MDYIKKQSMSSSMNGEDSAMVGIEGSSSSNGLPQPLKNIKPLPAEMKSDRHNSNKKKENQIPMILAKAAVAAKMKIIAGGGNRGNESVEFVKDPDIADGSKGLPDVQSDFKEDSIVRNLKQIVADDRRWELFALGALGLPPGSESNDTLRNSLLKGFEENAWDGIADLVSLYADTGYGGGKPDDPVDAKTLSSGLIERTTMWLTYTDYFETLFSAIQEKSLPRQINLYTNELLIRYLDTIGQ